MHPLGPSPALSKACVLGWVLRGWMVFVGSFSSTSHDLEEPLLAVMAPTLQSDQVLSVILHKHPTGSSVWELEVW